VIVNNAIYKHFEAKAVAPMLQNEVIYFATHLPYFLKYNDAGGLGKLVLRRILASKHVSKRILQKGKIGFGMNLSKLWLKSGKEICENMLEDARVVSDRWINREWIKRTISRLNRHLDLRYISKMLSLLAFEIWYRLFISEELSPNRKL